MKIAKTLAATAASGMHMGLLAACGGEAPPAAAPAAAPSADPAAASSAGKASCNGKSSCSGAAAPAAPAKN